MHIYTTYATITSRTRIYQHGLANTKLQKIGSFKGMKTSYNAEQTLSVEFAAPLPTQPAPVTDTSEVIITGYDRSDAAESFEIPGKDGLALQFHGIKDFTDRPYLKKFVTTFEVGDEYGLIHNAVSDLVDFNDAMAIKAAKHAEAAKALQDSAQEAIESAIDNATASTVKTVFMQMRLNRMRPIQHDEATMYDTASIIVAQMQEVIREDRALRESNLEQQPHIIVASKNELTQAEEKTSRSFGEVMSRVFNYRGISIQKLLESLPRSSEIPTTATQTLPTKALEATGITRP